MSTTSRCKECGTITEPGDVFCEGCGIKITTETQIAVVPANLCPAAGKILRTGTSSAIFADISFRTFPLQTFARHAERNLMTGMRFAKYADTGSVGCPQRPNSHRLRPRFTFPTGRR